MVLLGDYNNKNDQLDEGQMIRNVEEVRDPNLDSNQRTISVDSDPSTISPSELRQ